MKYLTKGELYQLLQAAKSKDKDTWIMLLVGYWHGLRASEIINIKSSHINQGYLTVKRLKGSKKTIHKLIYSVDPLLNEKDYLEDLASKKQVLFEGVSRFALTKRMKRLGESIGLPPHKCHAHVLKHSIAMHSKQGGANIVDVGEFLGHKNINSTNQYYMSEGEDVSAEIVKKAVGTFN